MFKNKRLRHWVLSWATQDKFPSSFSSLFIPTKFKDRYICYIFWRARSDSVKRHQTAFNEIFLTFSSNFFRMHLAPLGIYTVRGCGTTSGFPLKKSIALIFYLYFIRLVSGRNFSSSRFEGMSCNIDAQLLLKTLGE